MKSFQGVNLPQQQGVNLLRREGVTLLRRKGVNCNVFSSYVPKKEFSLQSNESSVNMDLYISDIGRFNGVKDIISLSNTEYTKTVIYTTSEKNYYLDMKSIMIANGFKFDKVEDQPIGNTPTKWYYYLKGNYTVILYSYYSNPLECVMYNVHVYYSK